MQTQFEIPDAELDWWECVTCKTPPRYAMGTYYVDDEPAVIMRCECLSEANRFIKPVLVKRDNPINERYQKMAETELEPILEAVVVPKPFGDTALTKESMVARAELIDLAVQKMREGVHYGTIPGTKDKSLWEPGAELLRGLFRIRWNPEIISSYEDFDTPEFRYTVRATAVDENGAIGAAWEASAWSKEAGIGAKDTASLWNNTRDRAIKRAFVNLMRNVCGVSGVFKEGA